MNAHNPFDAKQDWTNPYCQNSSNDPMVDALLGNAYHVVRTVYCNLGNLKLLYDFLNQYGMVLGVQSEAELKALTTKAKYARIYGFSRTGDRQVTDYLYVEGDRTGIIPDDPEATGSWITVATSGSSGGGTSSGEGAYIPWVYSNGSATGGETTINVPDGTVGVPFIIINGDMQYVGRGFEFNVDSLSVTLAQPLEEGDEVVFLLTGVPAVPDNPNVNDWVQINWLYNNGAAVGGEQVIAIPYTFQSVPAVYKNGLRLYKGLTTESYTADPDNQRIFLTEPLTTNDRLIVQIGGEARLLEVADRTPQEVARAANVKDSEVILSTDTTQVLNGKKVIYDVVSQRIYGLPALPTNVYIIAVSNGQLTYSPGNITVTLLDSYQQQNTRELWRRSLAEAGLTLADGSFEEGATAINTNNAVWHIAGGQCYTWGGEFPKTVLSDTTPETAGGIGLDKWVSVDGAVLRAALAKPSGPKLIGGLPFDSLYGDLSTTGDNTDAINERLNWSRTTGKTVELPSGRFQVSGELELGGVKVRGRSIGFRNSDGTVLVGSGQDRMFNQSESTFPYFAATKLESLRIENVSCGLEFGYLNRAEFEDVHIQCTGTGIRFGRAENSGPQWNTMRRCTVESIGGSALYMNGAAWCNNNTFELCFFESKQNGLNPAVVIDCAGGFGAIDNLFIGTEIASEGYGIRLKNARATHLLGAYLECYGPAIWLNGTSYGTKVSGGVFARQRNDNVTGVNWAIYHQSGNAFIEIDKPYIVISNPSEQDGCGFIGYSGTSPASGLVVDVTSDPHTENVGGVSYTRYQNGLFSKISKVIHGDQMIQSDDSPSLSLQYEDGTKKVEIYSNSIKGGSDFGGVLKVNNITRMQFTADGTKILMPGQKIGLPAEANTSAPGAKTHRIQVLSETGAFLGYLAVYSS